MNVPILSKAEAEKRSLLLLNDIAFLLWNKDGKKFLYSTDLRNTQMRALFVHNTTNKNFDLYASSFSDEKRKYEMLYILERNNLEMLKAWSR